MIKKKINPESYESLIIAFLAGITLLFTNTLKITSDAPEYFIRKERWKYYLWRASLFIIFIAFALHIRYLITYTISRYK